MLYRFAPKKSIGEITELLLSRCFRPFLPIFFDNASVGVLFVWKKILNFVMLL